MKIGILTFWWSQDNYGQLLQCFALQKYLRDMGHEAYLIRYRYSTDTKKTLFIVKVFKAFNIIKLLRYLSKKLKKYKITNEQVLFNREFDDFRNKYLCFSKEIYSTYLELKENPPLADAYIVGSDQVWNYKLLDIPRSNPCHAYFLDFGPENVKRLSYAASFGVSELPDVVKATIKPLLANFNYISVREENGVSLCKQCGCKKVEWVCDPTLLLDASCYRVLYRDCIDNIQKPEKKYIFLYMLSNECSFDIQNVYNYAASKKLDVVYVTGNGRIDNKEKQFPNIPTWLYLVDNSEYIITNSFHCGVFSSLFHKQFGIVPLSGNDKGMNARFDSLFARLGIESRYIIKDDFSVLDNKYTITNNKEMPSFIKYLGE